MTESQISAAVLLAYDQDPIEWRRRHEAGAAPDATPYGYERAVPWIDLRWALSMREGALLRRVRRSITARLGFDLVHTWRNRRTLWAADVIWTHTEREHLAVALLQRFRPRGRRVPVIAQSIWLWDRWAGYGRARRALYSWLLRAHSLEAVHSRLNEAFSRDAVPGRRVILIPFGSHGASQPGFEVAPVDVFAIGNDVHRDWALLADAARSLPERSFRVASGNRASRTVAWPPNVTVGPVATVGEVAAFYRAARVVALPLRENLHASGASVAIEAADCGTAAVATDAGGIADYLPPGTLLVPVCDAMTFARHLRLALDAPSSAVEPPSARGLDQLDYVKRYVLLSRYLVNGEPLDPSVSEFAPVALD